MEFAERELIGNEFDKRRKPLLAVNHLKAAFCNFTEVNWRNWYLEEKRFD
jgi:hypothetical protein